MHKIVYPETEEEVVPVQFNKPLGAAAYWGKNRHGAMWVTIKPKRLRGIHTNCYRRDCRREKF